MVVSASIVIYVQLALSSVSKNARQQYVDLHKQCIYHSLHFLDCFMWWLPNLATLPRFTGPQINRHKLAVVDLPHSSPCAQAIPALLALKLDQESHFITSFINMQTELVFFCSEKYGAQFNFCHACPIPHFIHPHTTAVYIKFVTY
jgi:hypothetical protein